MEDARDIVGTTVLVSLRETGGLAFAGIPGEGPFFCRVTAVDEVGLWVRSRTFTTIELADEAGRAVPKRKRRRKTHVVDILLPWRNVATVVAFEDEVPAAADAEALGEADGESRIGFVT